MTFCEAFVVRFFPLLLSKDLLTMIDVNVPRASARKNPHTGQLRSRRILVVEDSLDSQGLIMFLLEQEGASVEVAENGRVAVDRVAETVTSGLGEEFDGIVMDLYMPVMDGYEATAELRRRGFAGPIIALTAHVQDEVRERSLAAGCDDYLTKPVDRQLLVNTLCRRLDIAAA